ncbi:TadE/TadG family type IV pilus assembly protein [Actibacterium sp. XHP0104]|uniref:TadE/TadG family type IV pilus assembly protein n=1 Tax=Actibacterium sp. XHP0104 TaxID=2984335 RepID=UPI0021E86D25|nr:hypothetical protein [Actibacterium sp. XHP0104]MCV2881409.1 hypothetical protein [Actibacterium sp. XHP0104]
MWTGIKYELTRFWREEDASMIAEGVMTLPILAWWYVGSLTFFQAYEAKNVNIKAAYTISDMLSREDKFVDDSYMDGLYKVFKYLTDDEGFDQAIRVTQVYCSKNCNTSGDSRELSVDWSYGTTGRAVVTAEGVMSFNKYVPIMTLGDRAVIVETWSSYSPPFNVGLSDEDFQNIVVTRPRFVPTICYLGVNCEDLGLVNTM